MNTIKYAILLSCFGLTQTGVFASDSSVGVGLTRDPTTKTPSLEEFAAQLLGQAPASTLPQVPAPVVKSSPVTPTPALTSGTATALPEAPALSQVPAPVVKASPVTPTPALTSGPATTLSQTPAPVVKASPVTQAPALTSGTTTALSQAPALTSGTATALSQAPVKVGTKTNPQLKSRSQGGLLQQEKSGLKRSEASKRYQESKRARAFEKGPNGTAARR